MATSQRSQKKQDQLTFLLEEPPANPSQSRESVSGWMTRAGTLPSNFVFWLDALMPAGWFGRTCPESCRVTKEEILPPSSGSWGNAGLGGPTGAWTLNISEHTDLNELSLKDEGVSSLLDILETGEIPQRYYLSPTACVGILRRAEKRGRELPENLRQALQEVASLK